MLRVIAITAVTCLVSLVLELFQDLHAAHPRHRDVESDHAGLQALRQVEAFFAIARLPHDLDVDSPGEQTTDAGPDDRMVVDDQDSNHVWTSVQLIRRSGPGTDDGEEIGKLANALLAYHAGTTRLSRNGDCRGPWC